MTVGRKGRLPLHPEYLEMKKWFLAGWHTWNVRSVLSHVHMPDGLVLNIALKEYRVGGYLKETLIGRFAQPLDRTPVEEVFPGAHAYDESYTEISVRWCDIVFSVESTVDGDDVVLLATPISSQPKPPMMVLETGFLWNRPGWTELDGGAILAHCPFGERTIRTTGRLTEDLNIPVQTACLQVALDQPVAFYTGAERSAEEIRALLDARKAEFDWKLSRYGDLKGMYEAIECAMAWDTIYDPRHNRVVSPVSRLWSIGNGGYVLFCWDNFFAGFMASLGCKELAYSNLIEIVNERTEHGFVPNFAYATGQSSTDRSQPPVGSTMLLEVFRRYEESWIVESLYPKLFEWNTWFVQNRMNGSGALSWGSNPIPVLFGNRWETDGVHQTYGGALESGLDNSPMYDDIPFDYASSQMCLEDVGLTGLFIRDCRSLMEMARLIGRGCDIPELENRVARAEAGLEGLWDQENGFYYNRRTDTGEFSRRISPTNFYALFSKSVSAGRLRRIAKEHYFNPEEFYGDWMLPSIARNDPAFPDQDYWRGRVWAPLNFLVYMALLEHDLPDVRRDLADKSAAIFLKEWVERRHVHENYNSMTGEGCDAHNSDRFYHWGALLPVIALAERGYLPGFGGALEKSPKSGGE